MSYAIILCFALAHGANTDDTLSLLQAHVSFLGESAENVMSAARDSCDDSCYTANGALNTDKQCGKSKCEGCCECTGDCSLPTAAPTIPPCDDTCYSANGVLDQIKQCGKQKCVGCCECTGECSPTVAPTVLECDATCYNKDQWAIGGQDYNGNLNLEKQCCKTKCLGCQECAGHTENCDGTSQPPQSQCEFPAAPFDTCAAWGDPHYTLTFHQGSTKFDYMGLGVHRLARGTDGCFEVQAFQCPFHKHGASVFAAFAIKDGSHVVQVVGDSVYVDGAMVASDTPLNLTLHGSPQGQGGFCMTSTTCESVGHIDITQKLTATKSPGYSMTMAIRMASQGIDSSSGTCVMSPPEDSSMSCDDSLFTSDVMDHLLSLCGMPGCQDPDGYEPVDGPEDMCGKAGIAVAEAESACSGKTDEFKDACMYEYCASDADPDTIDNVPSTTAPPVPTTSSTSSQPTTRTTTTTTTTTTPPPTDDDGICSAFNAKYPDLVKVDFTLAEVTHNNLGGLGPDSGEAELYYRNVALANAQGDIYDLRVTVIGDSYTPQLSRRNGENGHYGQINVATGTSVDLKFQFINQQTGEPAVLQKLLFSWFDMDQGRFSGGPEMVTLWPGYSSTLLATVTEIVNENVPCPAGAGAGTCVKFSSSTGGTGRDNPRDPLMLTEQQAARTFTVHYESVSEFSVTIASGGGKGGRNFLFTGMSEVAYADVEECCPDHVCGCRAECAQIQREWEDKCTISKCSKCVECQTTTTTTSAAPASKEETCQDATTFGLSSDNLVENTLGEKGGRLLFKNVAENDGVSLDLSVEDIASKILKETPYEADRRGYTGEFRGAGRIAIDSKGRYKFRFKLLDSQTGATAKLPLFPFTLYDIDGNGESITACDVQGVFTYEGTNLEETYSDPCYTHESGGREVNLPDDFDQMNPNQKKQSVTYAYRNTGEWDIAVNIKKKEEDRYVIFKSSKILACDYEDNVKDKEWSGDKEKKDKNADQ